MHCNTTALKCHKAIHIALTTEERPEVVWIIKLEKLSKLKTTLTYIHIAYSMIFWLAYWYIISNPWISLTVLTVPFTCWWELRMLAIIFTLICRRALQDNVVANLSIFFPTGLAEKTKTSKKWPWLFVHLHNLCGTNRHYAWLPLEPFIVLAVHRMTWYFSGLLRRLFSRLFNCINMMLSWMESMLFSSVLYSDQVDLLWLAGSQICFYSTNAISQCDTEICLIPWE